MDKQAIEARINALRMAMESIHAQFVAIKPNSGQRCNLLPLCTAYVALDTMRSELEKQSCVPAIVRAA